ncbi:salicylate 1-monooxygenase [Paenalcaligenes hominis]|uniref:Salicylate hydroxylase n=1 Tax=Paenalcaligenes hominis TaxID=643674 RepID=A0ABX0WTB8_9BURK|nr:salicylate 1-monooxygenase [Paenalcaligenes hominis]NJB66005.1 salicylate hydroxylase [Paenalcaligenes hominis]GGE71348.1 salicylate 1-monooxygenase [Paenalcaligenes hominis]
MNSYYSTIEIGIVGGGITGVALALGLSRYSHLKVRLFESAAALGEVGAGVSFGANAVRAIQDLSMSLAYEEIADRTPAPWENVWFEWRKGSNAEYIATSLSPGVGQSSVHRADFLNLLAQQLPENVISFSKRAFKVRENKHKVTVSFTDGTDYQCDLLIGADGIKSNLRNYVLHNLSKPLIEPRFSGTCAYRGLIDSEQLRNAYRATGVDEHLINVPQMYLGLDAHVLTFPVKKGRLINVVAFVSDRSNPEPVWPNNAPWTQAISQERMLEDFSGWSVAVIELLKCIPKPTYWALHDLEELSHYNHGLVGLVGDAAHAMLPHQGAGAGQGLEDAWLLTRLLGDAQVLKTDLKKLLSVYDSIRRPRACRVQRTSWEAGELYEFRNPAISTQKDSLAESLTNRFDWLWNYNMETDLNKARKQLDWQ